MRNTIPRIQPPSSSGVSLTISNPGTVTTTSISVYGIGEGFVSTPSGATSIGDLSAGGSTTVLPAVQPLWAGVSNKLPGQAAPALSSALTFGNFDNGGASSFSWKPVGNGTGGVNAGSPG